MKEQQKDEAVVDVTPNCDVPVQLVVPHLDDLNQDVQFITRRIGANPEKSDLVNFRGPTKKNLVNSVFCCFSWEKSTNCSRKPGLVNEFSATPRGQLNWTGPIANSSDQYGVCKHLTYDEVTAEHDEDASLDDLPNVHHNVPPDVADDALLKLSKFICWMLRNVYL